MASAFKACSVDGCNRKAHSRGWCITHYQRWRTKGSTSDDVLSDRRHKKTRWLQAHLLFDGPDCLIWPFSVGDHGRGIAQINGVLMSAPRVMCIMAHGEPPTPEHHAAHSCGKGHEGCIHPQHLSWKTPVENEADKVEHGTLRRGEAINTAKLTEEDVRAIRRIGSTMKRSAIAKIYGLNRSSVWEIQTGRSWAWVV